jgi:hypothetical protein
MKKTRNIKSKKHNKLVNDYENQKSKHLERLATKMLKNDEKSEKLKKYKIKPNFLDKL